MTTQEVMIMLLLHKAINWPTPKVVSSDCIAAGLGVFIGAIQRFGLLHDPQTNAYN